MALCCKAVQFGFLAAQLTISERTQFLSKLEEINVNIMTSALFHYIMHASPNNQSDAVEMNTLMSNIILAREKEEQQNKTHWLTKHQTGLYAQTIGWCNIIVSASIRLYQFEQNESIHLYGM
eukprot:279752_1